MGTPRFAVPSLRALAAAEHDVAMVVTRPDRPQGRGKKLAPPPVKVAAQDLGLDVVQPDRVKEQGFVDFLEGLAADLLVVVAFGQILPLSVLNASRLGAINLHPSLLPKYRGPAPIPYAIMSGERQTGVCVMWLDEGLDTGDIIARERVDIGPDDTAGGLETELAQRGAALVTRTIGDITLGKAERKEQDHSLATYSLQIKPADAEIDWTRPATLLHCLIRGLDPRPGAWTFLGKSRIKVFKPRLAEGDINAEPGRVLGVDDQGLLVATGDGVLSIGDVQPPGKKVMAASAFCRGRKIDPGTLLGG